MANHSWVLWVCTLCFAIATFASLGIATGILTGGQAFYHGDMYVKRPLAFWLWIPACLAAAITSKVALGWLGELAADRHFQGLPLTRRNRLALGSGLGLAALLFVVDACIHHNGFLKTKAVEALNFGRHVSFEETSLAWLMATLFVIGFVVCAFLQGVMKERQEAQHKERLQEYEKQQREYRCYGSFEARLQAEARVAEALLQRALSQGLVQSTPLYQALTQDPVHQKIVTACNRVLTLEVQAKQAEQEVQTLVLSFEERLRSLEASRTPLQNDFFETDQKLIEEVVYSAHVELMHFQQRIYTLTKELELPVVARWLKRFFWFWWEPRGTQSGRR